MLPNYRGLLAIISPAVLRALTSQSAVLRFSRAAILAGLLPDRHNRHNVTRLLDFWAEGAGQAEPRGKHLGGMDTF